MSEKFIYIAVPSLNPNMLLLLNNEEGGNKCLSIGELLKEKHQQGNEMQIQAFSISQDICSLTFQKRLLIFEFLLRRCQGGDTNLGS